MFLRGSLFYGAGQDSVRCWPVIYISDGLRWHPPHRWLIEPDNMKFMDYSTFFLLLNHFFFPGILRDGPRRAVIGWLRYWSRTNFLIGCRDGDVSGSWGLVVTGASSPGRARCQVPAIIIMFLRRDWTPRVSNLTNGKGCSWSKDPLELYGGI